MFENENDRKVHTEYYFPKVEIKDYNFMVDGKNFSVRSDIVSYDNIRNIATGQGDKYTTGYLLDYNYFNKQYKITAIDLSKQQALDADLTVMQQINFTWNLHQAEAAAIFFIIEEAKKAILDFLRGTLKGLWMCSTILFCFNKM